MLTLCKKSGDPRPQRHGESQLILGPSRVLQSKYLFLHSETSKSLTPNAEQKSSRSHGVTLPHCGLQEPESPGMVEFDIEPTFGLFGREPGAMAFEGTMDWLFYQYMGQVGLLQEYRHDLAETVRSLTENLRSVDSYWWNVSGTFAVAAELQKQAVSNGLGPSSIQPNVFAPSLYVPFAQTKYFGEVQDELFTIACEARVVLRKVFTAFDRLLGCVAHILLVIRKSTSSVIRFFCSVRFEKRRWFLYHGARPPKETVQAILDPFTRACSESSLAY